MHYSKGHVLLKNSILFLLVMITFASTMNSCTVHKRVHRKGWFVQWHHNKSSGVATQEDHDSAVAQKDIQNDAPQPLVANKNPETSDGKSIPTDEVVVETKALEPTNPSEQVSDPIEEEPKDGKVETEEKVWHSTLPISIALVGAISFAVVLSIFGLIFILVPIALTTLIGLGTFMEIREIKFKQEDKSPKRQIWIMTAFNRGSLDCFFTCNSGSIKHRNTWNDGTVVCRIRCVLELAASKGKIDLRQTRFQP